MKKKILFLAHSQSIHTKRWVEYFIEHDWTVHIISFHQEKIKGAICHYFPVGTINVEGANYNYLKYLPQIIKLIYKIKPDIINSHFLSSFGLFAYLSFYGRHIINVHGTDVLINARKSFLRRRMYRNVLNASWHVYSVSDTMTNVLINEFKVPRSKITTIQYGVDLDIFRKRTNWDERPIDFITNRAFIPNSNYEFIFKVMNEIKKNKPDFRLLIVGDGPLKNNMDQWIRAYQLENNVELYDSVNQTEMAELLNKAKYFISFTSSDGTPLSLFEAAACGCYPVLSSNIANKEWVERGLSAKLITLYNIVESAEILLKLIDSETVNEELIRNQNLINQKMNYKINMDKVSKQMQTFLI